MGGGNYRPLARAGGNLLIVRVCPHVIFPFPLTMISEAYPPMTSKYITSLPVDAPTRATPSPPPPSFVNPLARHLISHHGTETSRRLRQTHDDNDEMRRRAPEWHGRKRAELKARPPEERAAHEERERLYQAKYRAKNRNLLRENQCNRRFARYQAAYGADVANKYLKARYANRILAQARGRAKNAYDLQREEDFEDLEVMSVTSP
ncbi:hypothetical protein R3P38DRAFT_2789810 [Favolaschia claudopus]|uniref:Uncharacterized protein n=1 Tax=Favolaschia claudopus TaxID=2862362 RepID=A0AAW0AIV1_9AGAR